MGTRIPGKSAVTVKCLRASVIFVFVQKFVSVSDHCTSRDVGAVVVNYRSAFPVGPPVVPPPSVATEVPESKACAKCDSRAVELEPRVWIPAGPDCYLRSTGQPRIV